ncbi:MAG: hypothetical protein R6U98_37575, partial [Pirellulaceae bacterium]
VSRSLPSNPLVPLDRTEVRDIGVFVRDDERFPVRRPFQQLAEAGFGVGDGQTSGLWPCG